MSILGDVAGGLAAATFLAIVANRLLEGLVKPIWSKVGFDGFYLLYVAWLLGGLLVWLSGINLFESIIPHPLMGQILTALVAGGGANFLHDLFDPVLEDEELPF